MRYELQLSGELVLMDGDDVRLSIPAGGELGIFYDHDGRHADGAGGTLLKHGNAENVMKDYRRHWAALQRAEPDPVAMSILTANGIHVPTDKNTLRDMIQDLEMITIPVVELSDAMVEEINACLATSGRVGRLKERLETIRTNSAPKVDCR